MVRARQLCVPHLLCVGKTGQKQSQLQTLGQPAATALAQAMRRCRPGRVLEAKALGSRAKASRLGTQTRQRTSSLTQHHLFRDKVFTEADWSHYMSYARFLPEPKVLCAPTSHTLISRHICSTEVNCHVRGTADIICTVASQLTLA